MLVSDRKCFTEPVTLSWFLKDGNELIREKGCEGADGMKKMWNFLMVLRFSEAYDLAKFWWPLEECLDLRPRIK
jgi:hypothetical protein